MTTPASNPVSSPGHAETRTLPPGQSPGTRSFLYTVYFIYFFCGMALCFEGAFNPEFKEYFQLGYQQQMYTMFAKNIPFALAFFIGLAVPRIGYRNCLTVAMFLFALGTGLLVPGLSAGSYALVLGAFFVVGLAFNLELVAGNPLLSALGPPDGSSSRLNLGNALGAIAQIIAPLTLTFIIPASAVAVEDRLPYMKGLFFVIAVLLALLGGLTLLLPRVDLSAAFQAGPGAANLAADLPLSRNPRVLLGFFTIFLVLGAEAGLFGLFRNYLEDPRIAGLSARESQRLFTLYFALFALGRLVGAAVQKRIAPARTLAGALMAALALLSIVVYAKGTLAVVAVLALGFFVSIFFPTLYSIAIAGLGEKTARVSGLLTMGFLGCAVLPVLQGRLADQLGLQSSYALWFPAYGFALFYALKGHALGQRT